jgi:DNA polymerase-1
MAKVTKATKTKKTAAPAELPPRYVVLIDSHAILHRGYHALPNFTSSKGEPTGALYGLCLMLLSIAKEWNPDHVIAAFDLPKPTYRHEAYQNYKAGRQKSDEALSRQIAKARDVFKAFGIPILEAEGFEADDVLGTLAEQLKADPRNRVVIASGDMDTLQLVSGDQVRVYTLKKGVKDTVTYDEAAVVERYGFGPELVADYKGLRGDPSDNIIGVPGIGEKTATELITKVGGIEEIYAALAKDREAVKATAGVTERIAGLLESHEEEARFSKMLATIRRDAPVSADLEKLPRWGEGDRGAVRALFAELEFRSLAPRVDEFFGGERAPLDAAGEGSGGAGGLFAEESPVDLTVLAEASVALWVLNSSISNPSRADVAHHAGTTDIAAARDKIFEELRKVGLWNVFERVERPLIPIVAAMNARGVAVDAAYLRDLAKGFREELSTLEREIHEIAGEEFNVASPKQLGEILFTKMGLGGKGTKKTAGGAISTREEVLERYLDDSPIVGKVLEYRELAKLLSTYAEKIPELVAEDGRLRTTFLQAGTTTGRMACADPNLQNIPVKDERGRAIRRGFVAPAGKRLLALDYSQIELRLAAILSGEEKLAAAFREGRDIHAEVASQTFGKPHAEVTKEDRRRAKVINFGILYGMGVTALQRQLGVPRADAQRFFSQHFEAHPTLAAWIERTKRDAARLGYTETLFGRRRYLEGIDSPLPFVRAQAERMAVNAPIQGTQADMLKIAMGRLDRLIEESGWRDRASLILQIHDELVFEVDEALVGEAAARFAAEMTRVLDEATLEEFGVPDRGRELVAAARVPIAVEAAAGENWAALERLEIGG